MAIIGVLLGITMTVLAGVIWYGRRELAAIREQLGFALEANTDTRDRLKILEKRKTLLTEAVTSQPKPAGVGGQKLRTWNEDAAPAEAVTR